MGGVPWGYGPKQFDIEADESSLVQLNVVHRGTIRGLNLRVIDGAGGSFTIYSSEDAARRALADANSVGSSEAGDIPHAGYILFSGTLTAGVFADHELNVAYINRDGSPTNPEPRLWMVINPDGAGTMQAVISMMIEGADL